MVHPRASLVLLCALTGCAQITTEIARAPEVEVTATRLLDGAVAGVAAVAPHDLYASVDGELVRLDPFAEAPEVLGNGDTLVGAVAWQDTVLLASDRLLTLDAFLGESALELPGEVTALAAEGDRLWVGTTEGLLLVQDDLLHAVTVGEQPILGPFAAGGAAGLWVASEDGLLALDRRGGTWRVTASQEGRADSFAVDGDGVLFAGIDGLLLTHDGQDFARFDLPGEVTEVFASPHAPGAWLRVGDEVWQVQNDTFTRLAESPPEGTWVVDGLGRLVVGSDSGMHRFATGRRVFVTGVRTDDVLEVPRPFLVETSTPDLLDTLTVTLDGAPFEGTTIDPIALTLDAHVLAVQASWTDGASHGVALPFFAVGLFDATWQADVKPLYANRCKSCHDGATQTVLNTAALWQARYADILDAVVTETMPLGQDPLSPVEIGVLKSWEAGGFPLQ